MDLGDLKIKNKYTSGPLASTDLHAGGIFFCTPYVEHIEFLDNGKVELTRSVIEDFRPMNGAEDAESYNSFQLKGNYLINSRGYLTCEFDGWSFTGLPLDKNPSMISFHRYHKKSGHQSGIIYTLE